jgi:AraC-like DNA-binding protein
MSAEDDVTAKSVLFNTHDLVLVITIYQCVLFAFFLLTLKKGKKKSHVLLATFLLAQACIPADNLINYGEEFRFVAMQISPNLFYTFGLAFWLEAPLLLLYIKSLKYKDYTFSRFDLLMFVPFLVFLIYFMFHWLLLDYDVKMRSLQGDTVANTILSDRVIHVSREVFRLVCTLLCLYELNRFEEQAKEEIADIASIDLSWLKILVIGFLVIHVQAVVVALGIMTSFEFNMPVDHEGLGLFANYLTMLLISALIFFSAGYSNIFKGINRDLNPTVKLKDPVDKSVVLKLESYMRTSKPYLNHLLTLDNLANQLQVSPRILSSTVNRHYSKNFFEFINHYRVEESRALLVLPEHKKTTMLDIMDLAGFNSKATFNTFFKRAAGNTPTQYRKDWWNGQSSKK